MILQDIPSALLSQDQSVGHVRGSVAKVVLEHARDSKTERRRLAQWDIATITGTSWEMVYMSLKSLQDEGAIRIERHRIIINKELLQEVVGVAGCNTK